MVWLSWTGTKPILLRRQQDRAAVTEEALVDREAGLGALDLAALGLPPELPRDLAHLGERLGGDRLPEAGQAAARVHGDPAADGGVAVVEQLLGLAGLAEADVL